MQAEVVHISPGLAGKYLAKNKAIRSLSPSLVKMYAAEMMAGRWTLTHQGIALNCDGSLRDGQHRLSAIIQSGVTVPMLVTVGVKDEAVPNIDVGRTRTLTQVSQFFDLDVRVMPTTRFFYDPFDSKKVANGELLATYQKHRPAIDFGLANTKSGDKYYYHANILAAILARAYYHTPNHARLALFPQVAVNGSEDIEDAAASIFRKWFSANPKPGGWAGVREVYGKSQNAVHIFLNKKPIKQLRSNNEDLFPVTI